jgi:hypothetical protein
MMASLLKQEPVLVLGFVVLVLMIKMILLLVFYRILQQAAKIL